LYLSENKQRFVPLTT